MARRKRQFLDDDDDSDSSRGSGDDVDFNLEQDPDLRDERDLFENPYKRGKRRKVNGKDDATYGVFGDDSEDEGFGGRAKRPQKRADWTKAPSFVSGDTTLKGTIGDDGGPGENPGNGINEQSDPETGDAGEAYEEDEADENSDSSDGSAPSREPSPRVAMNEEEEVARPRFGGLGMKATPAVAETEEPSSSTSNLGFSKGGIGSRGGIGSSGPAQDDELNTPSAFGSRQQRSFVREVPAPARPAAHLTSQDKLHFSKLQGSFGERMLSKMGWTAGTGLGAERAGIATPIESKLRPKNMGIAFKGFKEKTAQSKAAAKSRGEEVSDDDDEKPMRGKGKGKVKGKGEPVPRDDAWKKPRKSKVKIEHKTYEEIIAEAGGEAAPAGVGIIIDATGRTMREVSSLADVSLSNWTPTMDPTRLPEVRHNLRIITDACKTDLDGLAKEAKALEDRKKWIKAEDPRLRRKVEDEAELIQRLQAIHLVVDEISVKAKEVAHSDYEPTLDVFNEPIEKLLKFYGKEYERYRLDEIIVAAIVPIFKRMMTTWRPMDDPAAHTDKLRQWKMALKMNVNEDKPELQVDIYGTGTVSAKTQQIQPMTPYESLLWNVWLPRVRSFINNEWSPYNPQPAIQLFEAWFDILPTFIIDNVLDQLILPKIASVVSSWNPKKDKVSLHAIVFPWLPHVGLRMEEFVDAARRKIKSLLRSWSTSDGVPKDLRPWKEVFKSEDWESTLLKYVVPKLGATMREDFHVNPRNQDIAPLQRVLEWSDIIRSSVFGQLLEMEFFPKWLDVLHFWLVQPSVNFEEVAQWYTRWKESFPDAVHSIPVVEVGFNKALQLMDQALALGADAPKKLPKPLHHKSQVTSTTTATNGSKVPQARAKPSRMQEITFKSLVEDFVAKHNLLFMPAGKVHEKSRMPLYRVTRTVEGKGGLLVYLLDDAIWAPDGDDYRAISLDDMVLRATRTR